MFACFRLVTNLVFNCDFSSQGIISVPLLCEGQAILWPLVFGFQAPDHFAGVSVGRTSSFEFLLKTPHSKQFNMDKALMRTNYLFKNTNLNVTESVSYCGKFQSSNSICSQHRPTHKMSTAYFYPRVYYIYIHIYTHITTLIVYIIK